MVECKDVHNVSYTYFNIGFFTFYNLVISVT